MSEHMEYLHDKEEFGHPRNHVAGIQWASLEVTRKISERWLGIFLEQ